MARQPRAQAIQGERRRRKDSTLDRIHDLKLALPAEFEDDKDYDYRWANDVGSRLFDLTRRDDWDLCGSENPEASDEDRVRRPVGTDKLGKPIYAYLVRKPKTFVEEDRKVKEERLRDMEAGLVTSSKTSPEDTRPDDVAYALPSNSIRRGAFTP